MKTEIYRFKGLFKKAMNKMLMCFFMTLLFSSGGISKAFASENGEIKMEVLDEDGDPAMQARVTLLSGEQVIDKKVPDVQGIVIFKEVLPGTYDIKVEMVGMITHVQQGVQVSANKTSYVNVKMKRPVNMLDSIVIVPNFESMAQKTMLSGQTIDYLQFKNSATDHSNPIQMIVAVTPSVLPTADGKDIYSRGARAGTNEYLVDGEKILGSLGVPSQSIQGMTVYTGGVPACYGDFTGGLVMITTKSFFNGVQAKKNMYENIAKDLAEEKAYEEEMKQKKEEEKK